MNAIKDNKKYNLESLIPYATIGILLFGLIFFAYLGIHNRYWADDWCYNADFENLGFWETLRGYTYITTYAANRYSLTLFSGLIQTLGIVGVQIMTPLNLLGWFLGMYWILQSTKKTFDLPIRAVSLFSIVLLTLYFSLYTAPNLFQSVYWRSGVLPYGMPVITGVIVFGLLFHQATLKTKSLPLTLLAMLLAFITGGFSEAAAATLTTAILLYLGIAILYRKKTWAQQTIPPAVGLLIAAILSMVMLIASPTNAHRLSLYQEQSFSFDFIRKTIRFSLNFIKYSLLDAPLPHLAVMLTAGLLGYTFTKPETKTIWLKKFAMAALVGVLLAYLLIAASYAPSAYIEGTPPAPRTRIIPRFTLTLALVLLSYGAGMLIKQNFPGRRISILVSAALILMTVYLGYTLKTPFQLNTIYTERAALWDARSVEIQQAIDLGEETVEVYGIDGSQVGGIRDFVSGGVGRWINHCAADYYGLNDIIVTEP